jgi:hypothetical protein
MGKFIARPFINWSNDSEKKSNSKLKWYKIEHNYEYAGDILASFELVYHKV